MEKMNKPEEIGPNQRQDPNILDEAYKNPEELEAQRIGIVTSKTPSNEKTPIEAKKEVDESKEEAKTHEDRKTETRQLSLEEKREQIQVELRERLRKQQQREQKQKEKSQDREELNLDREFSTDETLRLWLLRTTRETVTKVVRVRTGSHTFKYEIYNQKGEEIGDKVLTPKLGGTDPRMNIWILGNDGQLEKKEVDSLLLTNNGRYGFATDRGNGELGDITKSYLVTRLPGGEYIAVQALEEQKRNREASNIELVKEMTASKKSDHAMKDEVEAAKTSKKIDAVQEDKVTDIREVEIVKLLKDEGFKYEEINKIFKTIYEGIVKEGMSYGEVETTVSFVKGLKEQGCSMNRIKEVLAKHQLKKDYGKDVNYGEKDKVPGGYEGRVPKRFA